MRPIIIAGAIGLNALGLGLALVACSDEGAAASSHDAGDSSEAGTSTGIDASDSSSTEDSGSGDAGPTPTSPQLGGCAILPANHIFNTPIAGLPKHPSSDAFVSSIGAGNLHADFGRTLDQSSGAYYGIPYNLVHASAVSWSKVRYETTDVDMTWNPREESDCVADASHSLVAPCTAEAAATPLLPIPSSPLVEGGIVTDPTHPYGDHHMVILDQDACQLWEIYHAYKTAPDGGWDIFGSAHFDLGSNALRPDTWTSADGAGFPILPLLVRAEEAKSGEIRHALRFTVESSHIRRSHTWPARHITWSGTDSTALPPMGQAFRIKADYVIPGDFTTQAKAILQALKTYGMYIADGGINWYITGDPSADWDQATISQIATVSSSVFEAVDLSPIQARNGFDANSGAVPPP